MTLPRLAIVLALAFIAGQSAAPFGLPGLLALTVIAAVPMMRQRS